MPVENGLPQYVSKHPKTKMYRYFRRPSKGVTGSAFVRSFGSKDRKAVHAKYAAIHAEAETYFDRLATGRALTDQELLGMSMTHENLDELFRSYSGKLNQPEDWHRFIAQNGTDQMKALADPDRDRLTIMLRALYAGTEAIHLGIAEHRVEERREYIRETFGDDSVPTPANAFTLLDAYKQAWLPSKHRPSNTQVEITRYVNEFTALNGTLDLKEYTRDHWAAWRADCLSKHGPGWTAFKRYTMMKTIVTEAIRAGLFERKHFTGQDIVLRKPARTKLRNEGWADDELKELWASEIFRVREKKHPDANYWVPLIVALTGARLSEVTGMQVPDVAKRHGHDTFYLARLSGKTESSRRIIPIPKKLIDLGWFDYMKTRPKSGPLFDDCNAKVMSQWFGRVRKDIGLTRKGCDLHAFRHHLKTLLRNVHTPSDVSDYLTGHAADNVGATYGKTELATALKYLNRIDLQIKVPKWEAK